MTDGLDRAHALLQPFRFGFPRIILGFAVYREQFDDYDYESKFKRQRELGKHIEGIIVDIARQCLPANTKHIACSNRVSRGFDEAPSYGTYLYTADNGPGEHYNTSADIQLLEAIATIAGQAIPVPEELPEAFQSLVEEESTDPDLQVEPSLRWYLRIWNDDRFVQRPDAGHIDVLDLRVCDDAFGATWVLLNEALATRSWHRPPEPQDSEETEIIDLIRSVGHRLTTSQILSEFSKREQVKAESTIKMKLARMVGARLLTNRQDVRPHKGYGLPEWD